MLDILRLCTTLCNLAIQVCVMVGVNVLAFVMGPAMTLIRGTLVWPQLMSEQLVLRTCFAVLFARASPLALLLRRICLTLI